MRCIAGITTFQPQIDRLKKNVDSIYHQVSEVVVVDNNSNNIDDIERVLSAFNNVKLIKNSHNEGIAFAMNIIGNYAYNNDYEWFLTLDQDSVCPPNMIETFLELIEPQIAIIVPFIKFNDRFIGQLFRKNKETESTVNSIKESEEILYAVSSGQFINTKIWKKAGGFWDYLFIDYVDQELCFHIRKMGYRIVRSNKCVLSHEPGITVKVLGIPTAKQNAIREYYCSRNCRLIYWLYREQFVSIIPHRPFLLTIKRIANVILVREDIFKKLWAIFSGIFDAYKWRIKYKNMGRVPDNN